MKTLTLFLLSFFCFSVNAAVWEVGVTKTYTKPSQVASLVNDNDTVLIDAGIYEGDVAFWTKSHIIIKGVGGKAHLKANGNSAGGKAIWVIQGEGYYIENIEFSGCKVPDKNGAGIRQEGAYLTMVNCYLHDNENGVLAGNNEESIITFISCEFARNGYGDGYTHNIYINHIKRFVMKYCYSHHAHVGHNIKSRAHFNEILYNRIMDEESGDASMQIDLPNGGFSIIMGNIIMQGPNGINRSVITYGLEGLKNPSSNIWIVNNTFVNKRTTCTYVKLETGSLAIVANNIYAGKGTPVDGIATEYTNFHFENIADAHLQNEAAYNYHLTSLSGAINKGTDLGYISAYYLVPQYEYQHPLSFITRTTSGQIDAGAYEFSTSNINENIYETPYTCLITENSLLISNIGEKSNLSIKIISTDGKIWLSDQISTDCTFNLNTLNKGIYFILISDDKGGFRCLKWASL